MKLEQQDRKNLNMNMKLPAQIVLFTVCLLISCQSLATESSTEPHKDSIQIKDPIIQAYKDLVYNQKPPRPQPGIGYGIDPDTGKFNHPKATPLVQDPPAFDGQLTYWDPNSYISNMEVIGIYPQIAAPFHSWQNIVDFYTR